jgi:hypothetical protein
MSHSWFLASFQEWYRSILALDFNPNILGDFSPIERSCSIHRMVSSTILGETSNRWNSRTSSSYHFRTVDVDDSRSLSALKSNRRPLSFCCSLLTSLKRAALLESQIHFLSRLGTSHSRSISLLLSSSHVFPFREYAE